MITIEHEITLPNTYPLKRFGPLETLVFFDIETTGFSGDYSSVYLIGCAFFQQKCWHLIQWFVDHKSSEPDVLKAFFEFLKNYSVLIHFNGDSFDIPFLLKRCHVYGLSYDFRDLASIDIYKQIRPYRKIFGLNSLKQKAVEQFLGIFRQDPYSGGQLIKIYQDYLNNQDDSLYQTLILHNHEDLEGMLLILPILFYPDFLEHEFVLETEQVLKQADESGGFTYTLCLILKSPEFLPVPICWNTPYGTCLAQDSCLKIMVKLLDSTLKFFYSNYKDYYYLIYEDTIIHKSLGEFVEKNARKPATARTCFITKTGLFLPQPDNNLFPVFQRNYKSKQLYALYESGLFDNPEILMPYVRYLLGLSQDS